MIQTGVIGYGFSAQTFHLPLITACKGLSIHSIASSQTALLNETHPRVQACENPLNIIHDPTIDLVIVTSPNEFHYQQARDCLENGKHVILEKPMVCSLDEGRLLLSLAHEKKLRLSVFHNRRWDGDFLTIKKLFKSGQLGDILFFESHFDRFRPTVRDRWRERPGPGAGMWYDLGPHLVDQVLCLFGRPKALTARVLTIRDKSEAADYFHVTFHYERAEILLHSSPVSAGPNCRFHIQGTKGSYIKYGLDPQEGQLKSGMLPNNPQFGEEPSGCFGILYTETEKKHIPTEAGSYLSYYQQIADSLTSGTVPPVSGADGLQVIELIELAERSSKDGRTIQLH